MRKAQLERLRIDTTPLSKLPGFEESLRLLVVDERYSITDIALMFGVSRERVRQLCLARGLEHPDGSKVGLHAIRVWDDTMNRFRPHSRGDMRKARMAESTARRRAAITKRVEARRWMIVGAVARLRERLGRDPVWPEIWAELGGDSAMVRNAAAMVLGRWKGYGQTTAVALRHFYEATGMKPMPRGRKAWVGWRDQNQQVAS